MMKFLIGALSTLLIVTVNGQQMGADAEQCASAWEMDNSTKPWASGLLAETNRTAVEVALRMQASMTEARGQLVQNRDRAWEDYQTILRETNSTMEMLAARVAAMKRAT